MDETTKYRGYTIEILPDENPWDPRDGQDNLGTMVFFHRRYNLGDKNHGINSNDFNGWDEMLQFIAKKLHGSIIIPVYMYDHSGVTISTSHEYPYNDRWDAGQLGFIFTTRKRMAEWYGIKPKSVDVAVAKKAYAHLQGEVDEYDKYLRGDVYGFVVTDKDGEEVDSCWGYYDDDAMTEAKSIVDAILKNKPSIRYNIRDAKGRFIKQTE